MTQAAGGATALVVEDDPQARALVTKLLGLLGYEVSGVRGAWEARLALVRDSFALAVCDLTLPGEPGLSLVRHVAHAHPDTSILIVSGSGDPAVAEECSASGAHGYLVKPFGFEQLAVTVANTLRRHELEAAHQAHQHDLEQTLLARTVQLRRSRTETVRRLALAVELRDGATRRHGDRTGEYALEIARALGLAPTTAGLIRAAAPLHDVGKIAVPDSVLHKPGPLTVAERALMQTHAEAGFRLLRGSGEPVLELAAVVARSHHERLDGSGYPRGLRGDEIPVAGRIVAVADVADALLSHRPYRSAHTPAEAAAILTGMRGELLESEMVDALLATRPWRQPGVAA